MQKKQQPTRRDFIATSTKTAAGVAAATAFIGSTIPSKVLGANDRINIAVVGIRSRGSNHIEEWTKIPGVEITHLVDADENFFPEKVKMVTDRQGKAPKTAVDLRKVLEDKNLHAISTATPNHLHAIHAIWACQAGKHVYAEKPLSHNVWEGRQLVKVARKYNRIVQCGFQNRSIYGVRKAIEFLHNGGLGDVYMARGLCFKPRKNIGRAVNAAVPKGLNWDLFLGPAGYRPFNPLLHPYNWHWFWDFGSGDIGNQGPHQFDIARWGLAKNTHPKTIHSDGGFFVYDSDQETPNMQSATLKWDDGKILSFEVRGLPTGSEEKIKIGNLFYGSKGWMWIDGDTWQTFIGYENQPGEKFDGGGDVADPNNLAGAGSSAHFVNFIEALRANDMTKLTCDVEEGHKSTVLPHLANISYRVGHELTFDSHSERFYDDFAEIANPYLTRDYRPPYIITENM